MLKLTTMGLTKEVGAMVVFCLEKIVLLDLIVDSSIKGYNREGKNY